MREIRFRAWDGKEMDSNPFLDCGCQPDAFTCGVDINNGISNTQTDGKIYLQYTGLKDKCGKEIWEGDILGLDDPDDNSRCIVVFKDGAFKRDSNQFLSREDKLDGDYFEKDFIHHFDKVDSEIWKVIGNIYSNSDLNKEVTPLAVPSKA